MLKKLKTELTNFYHSSHTIALSKVRGRGRGEVGRGWLISCPFPHSPQKKPLKIPPRLGLNNYYLASRNFCLKIFCLCIREKYIFFEYIFFQSVKYSLNVKNISQYLFLLSFLQHRFVRLSSNYNIIKVQMV